MSNYIGKKRVIISSIVFLTSILAIIVFIFYYTQLKKSFIDPTGDVFKKILFKEESLNIEFDKEILSNSMFLKLDDNTIYFVKKEVGNHRAFENPRKILERNINEKKNINNELNDNNLE